MRSTRARITVLLAATAAVVGLAPAAPAVAEVSGGVTIPAFYDPPATLPAANGAIVRSQPTALGVQLNLPGIVGPLPGSATLIMYKSTDSNNQPVAVTGTYIEPDKAWGGPGPRPLVTFAEGTQGQGDQCAPSYGLTHALTVTGSTVVVNYEIPAIYSLLAKGVAVVVTDYVGLGTTDRLHTYVNRVDEGHAVLDAARAALAVPGASVTAASKVGAYGYSQGGGASASAAELQPTYAPDVNLVGAYAGAPPADLNAVIKGIDGTSLAAAIGWALNGFVQSYPQLQPIVDANVTASGRAQLKNLEQRCTIDGVAAFAFRKTSSLTTTGESLTQVIARYPAAQAVVDAQRIGRIKPSVPVRIASGTRDDLVDHAQVKQLARDWCGLGASVFYAPLAQALPTGGTGLNHIAPAFTDQSAAQGWLLARLTGVPATSNCALVPALP